MPFGDFRNDGQSQPASLASGRGDAIEALEDFLALGFRNAGPVVLDLEHRLAVAYSRAHRDAAARLGIRKRIVEQIRDQLAQQQRLTQNPCILELEAEIDVFPDGTLHPVAQIAADDLVQVDGLPACRFPGLRARQGEKLIDEVARALSLARDHVQKRLQFRTGWLAPREFRVSFQSRKRRAQLVRSIGDEALLRFDRRVQPEEQSVEGADQRPHFLRLGSDFSSEPDGWRRASSA